MTKLTETAPATDYADVRRDPIPSATVRRAMVLLAQLRKHVEAARDASLCRDKLSHQQDALDVASAFKQDPCSRADWHFPPRPTRHPTYRATLDLWAENAWRTVLSAEEHLGGLLERALAHEECAAESKAAGAPRSDSYPPDGRCMGCVDQDDDCSGANCGGAGCQCPCNQGTPVAVGPSDRPADEGTTFVTASCRDGLHGDCRPVDGLCDCRCHARSSPPSPGTGSGGGSEGSGGAGPSGGSGGSAGAAGGSAGAGRLAASREVLLDYMFAGEATLTLVSPTGTRFTYRIAASRDGVCHWVRVLTGPCNESDYSFLGTIFDRSRYAHNRHRYGIAERAPSAVALRWFLDILFAGKRIPSGLEVYHDGRCARCHRALTVPSSVATGLGPDCAEIIGRERQTAASSLARSAPPAMALRPEGSRGRAA